jgi:hypothetical protein
MAALVSEAMRKAAVAWLEPPGRAAYPVWCHWIDDALYLVSGAGEQSAPGLHRAGPVAVTARGDHGGAIVTWSAHATRVRPGTPNWSAVVPVLAAKRLNSAPAGQLVDRWATDCVVTRLTPR